MGGALGVAILASVAASVSGGVEVRGRLTPQQLADLTSGFQAAFLVGAGFALAGALAAATLISSSDSREMARATRAGETVAVVAL